jgi:hypothetical protein
MNILQSIMKANYAATGAQVETLAHAVALGKLGESTYLRIVAVHCQADLGTGRRRMAAETQEAVIDKVHGKLYPHVLKGVASNGLGSEELPQAEVNRRSTFARSSASELRRFVNKGGDIRTLDAANLTRSFLRKFGAPVPTGTRAERSLARATEATVRAAERVARGNPDAAAETIEATIESLQKVLNALPEAAAEDVGGSTTVVPNRAPADRGMQRTRVGVPQLHRSA